MIKKVRYPGVYFGEGVRWQSYRLTRKPYSIRDGCFCFHNTIKPYFIVGDIVMFWGDGKPVPKSVNREIHYERCQ
jgi:hypothetical protein